MDWYAGVDVSSELSSICIVDASGQILREVKAAGEPEALTFFAGLSLPLTCIGPAAGPLAVASCGLADGPAMTSCCSRPDTSRKPCRR
jgi:hypothetical protein